MIAIYLMKTLMTITRLEKRFDVLAALLFSLLFLCTSCAHRETISQQPLSSWKFAVISDTQDDNSRKTNKTCINDAVLTAIAEDIAREKPDLVIVSGDLVNGWFRNWETDYDTQYANWKRTMAPVYEAGIRVYPIRGNHDSGPERLALPPLPAHLEPSADTPALLRESFRRHFSETYIPQNGPFGEKGLTYSFVHKNAFFVGLDQYAATQHKVHQAWLDGQLAENIQPHVFVYGHEPAFGAAHRDNLGFFREARDSFWNAIGAAGARIYFCGHDHFYNRALILDDSGNAIRQIIAGTGGGVLRKWSGIYQEGERVRNEVHHESYHGYVLVTIDNMKATVIWKALTAKNAAEPWEIMDIFSYSLDGS